MYWWCLLCNHDAWRDLSTFLFLLCVVRSNIGFSGWQFLVQWKRNEVVRECLGGHTLPALVSCNLAWIFCQPAVINTGDVRHLKKSQQRSVLRKSVFSLWQLQATHVCVCKDPSQSGSLHNFGLLFSNGNHAVMLGDVPGVDL